MANPIKIWHLCPTFDIPAPLPNTASVLQIGDLIVSKTPHDIRNPLNRSSRPHVSSLLVENVGPRKTTHVVNTSGFKHIGFFAKVAQLTGVGAEIATSWSSAKGLNYRFESENDVILRNDLSIEQIRDLITASNEVQEFLVATSYRRPLYLVTGIKWVDGISILTSGSKSRSIDAQAEVDLTATGAPIEVGTSVGGGRNKEVLHTIEGGPPFVFCIRLQKLRWRRMGELKKQKDELRGTFMNVGKATGGEEFGMIIEEAGAEEFDDSEQIILSNMEDRGEFEIVFDDSM